MQMRDLIDLREGLINLMLQDWLKGKAVDDLARDLLVGQQTVEELLRQILPLQPSEASPQPAAETESQRARRLAIEAAEEHDRQAQTKRISPLSSLSVEDRAGRMPVNPAQRRGEDEQRRRT